MKRHQFLGFHLIHPPFGRLVYSFTLFNAMGSPLRTLLGMATATAALALASCESMSVEEEFANFEPTIKTAQESEEDKAMRMFGGYDPEKVSDFQDKKFSQFAGKDAKLRSSFEKKSYNLDQHPYFKLRETGYFSDKKPFTGHSAREGSKVASWQQQEDSWFKRTFSRKESTMGNQQVPRRAYDVPQRNDGFTKRNVYERTKYPLQIISDPNQGEQITKDDLNSLLNYR